MERIKRRSPPWGQLLLEESELDPDLLLFSLGTGSLWLPAVTLGDRGVGVCGCPCLEELAELGVQRKTELGGVRAGGMFGKGSG